MSSSGVFFPHFFITSGKRFLFLNPPPHSVSILIRLILSTQLPQWYTHYKTVMANTSGMCVFFFNNSELHLREIRSNDIAVAYKYIIVLRWFQWRPYFLGRYYITLIFSFSFLHPHQKFSYIFRDERIPRVLLGSRHSRSITLLPFLQFKKNII